jgi:hypothetical protein
MKIESQIKNLSFQHLELLANQVVRIISGMHKSPFHDFRLNAEHKVYNVGEHQA